MQLEPIENDNWPPQKVPKLGIPVIKGFEFIPHDTLYYLKASGNYTVLSHIVQEEGSVRMKDTLSSKGLAYFEDKLSKCPFIRIHDSYIVNLTKITKYTREGKDGRVVLDTGKSLVVSRTRKHQLLIAFGLIPAEQAE